MNVLANDRWGPTGLKPTISSWDADGLVGTVTLVQNVGGSGLQGFSYSSNGFVGTEQFTYTIIDTNGATSTGKVTVQMGAGRTSDDLVRFRLETRDTERECHHSDRARDAVPGLGLCPGHAERAGLPVRAGLADAEIRACFPPTWTCCTTPRWCPTRAWSSRRTTPQGISRRRRAGNPG